MSEAKLLTPKEMIELSEKGKKEFKETVLQGPTLKHLISNIESAALEGYLGFTQKINSSDDIRELYVIRDYLIAHGYHCEFKTLTKKSLICEYKEKYLVIHWGEKNNPPAATDGN